jgi:hypothetical protein
MNPAPLSFLARANPCFCSKMGAAVLGRIFSASP